MQPYRAPGPPPPPPDHRRDHPRPYEPRPYPARDWDDRARDRDCTRDRRWDDAAPLERDHKAPRYDDSYDYDHRARRPPPFDRDPRDRDVPPPRRDDYSYAPPPPHRTDPDHAPYAPTAPHSGYPPAGARAPAPWSGPEYPPPAPAGGAYHSAPPPPPPAAPAHQHHHPHYRAGGDDAGSPHPSRAPVRAEPASASVVFLGLPAHVDDAGLRAFLEDLGASVDSTTVIYDRPTGLSKRYGFAKFSSVEHARAFVEPHFPSIPWRERVPRPDDDGLRIKINYSQKTGGWREDQGAGARLTDDHRKANDGAREAFYVNDGTRDVGSAPTQILLLRGLDPLTVEEEIAAALAAIPGRVGAQIRDAAGLKKIMITRDRASRSSWGYAFVQFADVRLATEVLASAFNPQFFPTGFRIRASVVAFCFSHENSFVPIYAKSEFSFRGEGGQQLAYWDDKAFVTPWMPPSSGAGDKSKGKEPKPDDDDASAAEADMEAFFSSIEAEVPLLASSSSTAAGAPPVPSASSPFAAAAAAPPPPAAATPPAPAPSVMPAPGSISISLKPPAPGSDAEERLKAIMKARKGPPGESPAAAAAAAQDKKKSELLIVSRKAAKDISKWNVKQQELNPGVGPAPPAGPSAPSASSTSTATSAAPAPIPVPPTTPAAAAAPADDDFEYGDPVAMICLLCQRQFKTVPDLTKHNRLSALHKTNLGNTTTTAAAAQRKLASLKKAVSASPAPTADAGAPKYIDRAAARREAFNQPDHPVPELSSKKRKLGSDAPIPPPTPPPPPEQPNKNGIDDSNVGAKMLEKMGWSKGGGLGSSGTGIVDPIKASQFQQGAGLGSTKGVVVGEGPSTATPASYKEALREKARQRLEEERPQ